MKTIDKLREDLKAKGWNSRQVSVKSGSSRYDTRIDVTIKDITIPIHEVEEVAKKYEEIERCQASDEILAGCNTYVFVAYDWNVRQAAIEARKEKAAKLWKLVDDVEPSSGRAVYAVNGKELNIMKADPKFGVRYDRAVLYDTKSCEFEQGGIDLHNVEYLALAIMKVELYGTLR